MGALGAHHRFAAITGSKLRIKFYPLLARSQLVGVTAAVSVLRVVALRTFAVLVFKIL